MHDPRNAYIKPYTSRHQEECDRLRNAAETELQKHNGDYLRFAVLLLAPVLGGWLILVSLGI